MAVPVGGKTVQNVKNGGGNLQKQIPSRSRHLHEKERMQSPNSSSFSAIIAIVAHSPDRESAQNAGKS